jgi:hypothetical protein
MLNSAQWKHCQQLIIFFVFNVVFLTADIYSDFGTAFQFFSNGDFYWGLSTLLPIFAPMMVRILIALWSLLILWYNNDTSRIEVQIKTLPRLLWHIPILHPIM